MKTILDTEITIGHVKDPSLKTTHITFDFQGPSDFIGAVFHACDDIFTLTIKPDRLVMENDAAIIDGPIELQENEDYRAECGVKINSVFWEYVLYVRIWQEEETPAKTYTPKRQSNRRMLVAQKRQDTYKDILGRKTKQPHWRFTTKKRYRRASLERRVNMIQHALEIDKIVLRCKMLMEQEA